ncbi:MAG: toprim domain-containing protein [Zoogloeaceae bacterium]|jgi:putative DNA primase/helicase|nr:toprim domain-containing protein [Zoogloeaceae bacterium]
MNFVDFAAFAYFYGLILDGHPVRRITRCPTVEKPRKKNGSFFFDGEWGWVCNWNRDGEIHYFLDQKKTNTEAERRAYQERARKAEAHLRQTREKARQTAREMIQKASLAPHPYLACKGFPEHHGLVSEAGELLIPIKDIYGLLMSLQRVFLENNEWQKKMLLGGKTKGGVFKLGGGKEPVLCEGYATGLSIRKALDRMGMRQRPVLVCFSAGNLVEVSKSFRGSNAIVCADNDASLTGQKAAEASGLPWVMPEDVGLDFNDLHQRDGLLAVAKLLQQKMS